MFRSPYSLTTALTALLAAPSIANASDYVIDTDVTTRNGGYILRAGDSLIVTETGAISVTGSYLAGVRVWRSNDMTFTNSGTISATGFSSAGVDFGYSDNMTLTNSGTISATGDYSNGVFVRYSGNMTLTNSGTISATGDYSNGVRVLDSDDMTLTNSGTISATGYRSYAVGILSIDDMTLTNSGTISATGYRSDGLRVWVSQNTTLTNSGTISATGYRSNGVSVSNGDDMTLTNSGMISAIGESSNGVSVSSSHNMTFTNSGTISAAGDHSAGVYVGYSDNMTLTNSGTISNSIHFDTQSNHLTLNLLAGSVLGGDIHIGDARTATLNFGPGLNAVVRFGGTVPYTITAAGGGYGVSGNTVYAVSGAGFSAQDSVSADLTARVARAVKYPDANSARGWVQVLGDYRDQDAGFDGYQSLSGGLLYGRNLNASTGYFFGVSNSNTKGDMNAFDARSTHVYGGIYHAGSFAGADAKMSLSFGVGENTATRNIANNSVLGGMETSKASYSSVFVSPEITLSKSMPLGSGRLTPSFGLQYAALFTDGYTETGTVDSLSVGGRTAHMFEVRSELGYDFPSMDVGGGVFDLNLYGGAALRKITGDDVALFAGGSAFGVASSSQNDELRGYVGLKASLKQSDTMRLTGGIEFGRGSNQASTISANLAFNISF